MWSEHKDSYRNGSEKIAVRVMGMNHRDQGGSRLGNRRVLGRNNPIKANGGERIDLIYLWFTWITVQIIDLFNLLPL